VTTTDQVYNQNQPASDLTGQQEQHCWRNDTRVDITVTPQVEGWQLLGGYTFSTTRVDATSVSTPNNAL
jgi:long-subunit fatty acid transport protein